MRNILEGEEKTMFIGPSKEIITLHNFCKTDVDLHNNTTNVKNMYLHRDSNPGPWNTVMTSHVPTSGFVCFVHAKAKNFNVKQIENETQLVNGSKQRSNKLIIEYDFLLSTIKLYIK